MEMLDRRKSEEILSRLFHKSGRTDPNYIKKYFRNYLDFKIIILNFSSLPLLWSPQKRRERYSGGL